MSKIILSTAKMSKVGYLSQLTVPIKTTHPEAKQIAISLLQSGGIIGIPTDTVYGLACNINNVSSINKMYSIKCRAENKPMAICLPHVKTIPSWTKVNHLPKNLLTKLLPGPVTLLLEPIKIPNKYLSNEGKIGIRVPEFSFITELLEILGTPLALTSANVSHTVNSVKIEDFEELWEKLSAVFDGGDLQDTRNASTVIDLTEKGFYRIARNGIACEETIATLQNFGLKSY